MQIYYPRTRRHGTWMDVRAAGRERQRKAIEERELRVGSIVTTLSGEEHEIAAIKGHQVYLVGQGQRHYNPVSLTKVKKGKAKNE